MNNYCVSKRGVKSIAVVGLVGCILGLVFYTNKIVESVAATNEEANDPGSATTLLPDETVGSTTDMSETTTSTSTSTSTNNEEANDPGSATTLLPDETVGSTTEMSETTTSTTTTTTTTIAPPDGRRKRSAESEVLPHVATDMSQEQPAMHLLTSIPICVLGILVFMTGIVTNCLLFRGVKKDVEGLIMLWLVWTALLGLFEVINVVVESDYETKAVIGVVHIIMAPIIVCCWVVVFYYRRMVVLSKEYNVQGNVDKSSYQEFRNMESSNII